MKMSKQNLYRRFLIATKGIFLENPVLTLGLALPFAVVACSSLQTAVGLSVGALMALIPAALLLPLVMKQIPEQYHGLDYPLCALLSAIFIMPTRLITADLSPALMDSVGVYFSLFCVSSLLFTVKEKCEKEEPLMAFLTLLKMWLGVGLVLILVGTCREILGYGTLWNKPLTFMKIRFSGVMVSGFGFILLGFLAALGRKLHRCILSIQFWLERHWPKWRTKLTHIFERDEKTEKHLSEEIPQEESAEGLVQKISEEVIGKEQIEE